MANLIFVSYSKKDKTFAHKLADDLEAAGYDIWIDREIEGGVEWRKTIEEKLRAAREVIVIISPNSIVSKWVNHEATIAHGMNKKIFPLLIEPIDVELPLWLDKTQWIDVSDVSETAFKELTEVLTPLNPYRAYFYRNRLVMLSITLMVIIILMGLAIFLPNLDREAPEAGNWISIPAGSFIMGFDQEEAEKARQGCLDGASEIAYCYEVVDYLENAGRIQNPNLPNYKIMDNEVTNGQYSKCVEDGTCQSPADWSFGPEEVNKPAANLNWFEAMEYCQWLGGRLPTQGEWEKAARDSTERLYPWGNSWDPNKANLENQEDGKVERITEFAESDVNNDGVKNMAGNVREWTASECPIGCGYSSEQIFSNQPLSVEDAFTGTLIVLKGGSWRNERSTGMIANWGTIAAELRRPEIGFRCVCLDTDDCKSP
jgi:formylglycine-generating enzyme required for sulfatase activity